MNVSILVERVELAHERTESDSRSGKRALRHAGRGNWRRAGRRKGGGQGGIHRRRDKRNYL